MDFDDAVTDATARWDWRRSPYFLALPTLEKPAFVASQVAFREAVVHFGRPMAMLAARADDAAIRRILLANAWEEHGSGDPTASHQHTFDTLLARLGATPAPIHPVVDAFNAALDGVCTYAEVPGALATLGFIELQFAAISRHLGRVLVERGWLTVDQVVHYAVHQELDLEHAEQLFAPLRSLDPSHDAGVRRGLDRGGYLFDRLYRDLLP